jgi:NAD(P)H-dependent flavin oxidoreductase YrpB (nitropropane dioxygenase family)
LFRPLLERLGISLPVFQAGMGGGVAGPELAAAVSESGGLGTIGILPAALLQRALARARTLTARPIAVNLLLPFTRPEHWGVAAEADAVVTFWGVPVRRTSKPWIHQCGSVAEAHAAQVAGADAVIAQGVQAGGHVRGTLPALRLLEQIRAALPGFPVLLAGGVADAGDVRAALDAGADGVVSGTRFLLSDESAAHPEYKRRLIHSDRTVLTELFGFGWPRPHRVVPNAATERWLRRDSRGPALVRAAQQLSGAIGPRLPMSVGDRLARNARLAIPLYGPAAPLASWPEHLLDTAPLYAGETVARINDIRPAGELVRLLAG